MANPISDEAFARAVNQMGAATLEHIDAAKASQAEQVKIGVLISLADVLIQQGVITPILRETIEKKLQAQQQGGIKQLGKYKLLKKLGEGGMGAVYLAEDTAMLRNVALKVLPKKYAGEVEFLTRFKREAKATGKLNHVNIISAHDAGEDQGHHFYAMEYCEGEPLDARLKREQFLPWDKAIEIVMQVARGLKHAHEHGFIHRDIKPANVFITQTGVAKILDLGLSKDISDSQKSFNTQTGVAMGTPHYISPEQARGDKDIDGRTDIYSLGATLYHLVTGETPFQGSTAALIMMKHLSEQLPNPQDMRDDIPDGVVQVIQKMMTKEPSDRYADCAELLADLELVIDGKSPSSLAIDVGKSSIAMPRAPRRTHRAEAIPRKGRTGGPIPPVGTNRHEPVAARRDTDRRGTAQGISNAKKNNTLLYIACGVAVLGVLVFVIALSGSGKKAETASQGDVGSVKTPTPATESAKSDVIPAETTKTPVTATSLVARGVDDAWIKSVQALPVEVQVKKVLAKLQELNPGFDGQAAVEVENGQIVSFRRFSTALVNPAPLRAFAKLRSLTFAGEDIRSHFSDLSCLSGLKLTELNVSNSQVSDLTPLKGMQLNSLTCSGTAVANLAPLAEMPLKSLHVNGTPVSELAPLKGLPLVYLNCEASNVRDLSPLSNMHALTTFICVRTKVTDLSPLTNSTSLTDLTCDFKPERDMAILKSIKTLVKINRLPVAEFWAKNGGGGTQRSGATVDLLKLFDAKRDAVRAEASIANGEMQTGGQAPLIVQFPYSPPEEYDLRVEFTPQDMRGYVEVLCSKAGHSFRWTAAKQSSYFEGFAVALPRVPGAFVTGTRYSVVIQVRNDGARAWLNDKPAGETSEKYIGANVDRLPDRRLLGLATHTNPTTIHRFEVIEVSGKGIFTRPDDPAAKIALAQQEEVWAKKKVEAVRPASVPADAVAIEGRWYKVFNITAEPNRWDQVKARCEKMGGRLAMPKTKGVLDQLFALTPPPGNGTKTALGAYKENGAWKWLDGQSIADELYPKNKGKDGHILIIHAVGGPDGRILNDFPGVKPQGSYNMEAFICEWDSGTASQADSLPKETTLDLGGVKMEMVLVPAGEFMMGSNDGPAEEKPVHKVKIRHSYYMGKFTVTQEQWEQVMGTNPSHFKNKHNPVETVSWDDAQAFCKKLSESTNQAVRLPTEAEWEYACRAGTTTKYCSGDTEANLARVGWYGANSNSMAHPVGQKEPNKFGLYDMHGNLWQWCLDWYSEDYYRKAEPENPQGPDHGAFRLLRGGSWQYDAMGCRSADRGRSDPARRNNLIGFRVVVVPSIKNQ